MLTDKKRSQENYSKTELWGGVECTINRVNDSYFDQLDYAGHYTRPEDLSLIAGLGIKTLRYPVLWEYHQPEEDGDIDWTWTAQQLSRLEKLGITPIAGLLHHGSGPSFTNLLDEKFAEKFADYALRVAHTFPWLDHYTPINEPLTTARFSGLYGFWFPHMKNDVSFAKMLLNQVKGVVLAMRAIRQVNPAAKLVQTEDLGKTYCSPSLQYQANFENERRWLTWDLLCGHIRPGHKMWDYFIRLGIAEKTLRFFCENPCPPDIIGINHYITSERFLDEAFEKYPDWSRGGNELQLYADIEACRVPHGQPSGLGLLLKEAWQRYQLPLAVTEVQLNCGREDQSRWLKEVWDTCSAVTKEGVPIKAVTAWALLGSYGWDKLLTTQAKNYEPGAFDISSGIPRPTALVPLIQALSAGKNYDHPVLEHKGWWHRDVRFIYQRSFRSRSDLPDHFNSRPVLITGKNGTLGKAFGKICGFRSIHFFLLSRQELDISNEDEIADVIKKYDPWAIINAAGFVNVDAAETEVDKCFTDNARACHNLAKACKKFDLPFLTFSSDLVFDGNKSSPYLEGDQLNPLNAYGRSKAEAENLVLRANPSALIIRTSAFFGPWDDYNFVSQVVETLSDNKALVACDDVFISPTYVPDLVNVALDLLVDNEKGIWHVSNKGCLSWAGLARKVSNQAGLDTELIEPRPSHELNWVATRPRYSVLGSEKGIALPALDNALLRYFEERSHISNFLNTVNPGHEHR